MLPGGGRGGDGDIGGDSKDGIGGGWLVGGGGGEGEHL